MLRRSLLKWVTLTASAIFIVTLSNFLHDHSAAAAPIYETRVDAGSLQALDKNGKPTGECPLKHTDVKAEISGFLSRVTVTQEFINPFTDKIEAVYTFPLPQSAAIDDMTMLIGERIVKGKIMRREEAQAAYAAAKERGQVASLLDQERPNIFTQAVANIMPGQEIRITISYVETLKYTDGSYEWSFPMVVGQRYLPNGDQEPDGFRLNPPVASGMRAGHDVSLEIDLNAGVPIESLTSETHETEVERTGASSAIVRLKDRTALPNKDFVIHYQVAGNTINDAVLAHRTDRGGFFTLILQPPQRVLAEDVAPKELVFVLDTSGSMDGFPFEKARETTMLALDNLYSHDTFNVITFAGETEILFSDPVPATPENVRKAKKFLKSHRSDGGTEMMKAIKAALEPSDSQQHVRITCFLTDGHVGNDMDIIAEVQKHPNARVFAMGFSHAPNRFLLDKMAEYGRGEVDYVSETGDTSDVARRFNERIRNPLLTDVSVDWSGLPVSDLYPTRIPDLFSVKPVILSGRYAKGARGTIRLKGRMAGHEFVREIPIELPENEPAHDVLATLWARHRIDELMGQDLHGFPAMQVQQQEEITQLGLNFKLMTQFTSFVAVDEVIFTGGEASQRVEVPVEALPGSIPSGVTASVMVTGECADMSGVDVTCTETAITTRSINELPLQGRSFHRLLILTPGTVPSGPSSVIAAPQSNVSVNGQRATANTFVIDGVNANFGIEQGGQSPGASAAGTMPALTASGGTNGIVTLDAVQEMRINTSVSPAQYGRVPGAHVEIVTRAGANTFRGSLFHFFGNNTFDASEWFANSRGLAQPPRRLNNFGGTLGGPILKNKTFFFASYEGLRLRQPITAITDVPSLSARQAAADELRPFLAAFPLPNNGVRPDGFAEFDATFANPAHHDIASIRVDQMPGNDSQIRLRYNFADSDATMRGPEGFSLNTTNTIRSRAQSIAASLTRTISPTTVFELRGNYSRLRVSGSYLLDDFGGAVVPAEVPENFTFDLSARGASLISGSAVANVQRQFNFVAAATTVSGGHQYRFGGDYRRSSPLIASRALEEGVFFNGVAEALTGLPTRVSQFIHLTPQTPVFDSLSLYAQDDWKWNSRLKLSYGLRWELNPAPRSDLPLAVNQLTDPARLKTDEFTRRLWNTTYANFAPRFSFAYNVSNTESEELTLHGGVGLHYDLGQNEAANGFVDSVPFLRGTTLFNTAALPAGGGLPFIAFDPHLKLPYTTNWNVSLQRALGPWQRITASYVAAAGRRLLHTQTLFDQNPEFPFLRLVTNRAHSDYRSLQLQFDRSLAHNLRSLVSYTWARSIDNSGQDSARRVLLTSLNPDLDHGPSDFDVRHTLNGFISYELPAPFSKGVANKLSRNWTIESLFNGRSAKPVNVLYAFPTSYGFVYVRPNVLAGQPLYVLDATAAGGKRINQEAFVVPASFELGNLGRNRLRGFPFYQIDVALRRGFNFSETTMLQFQTDAFNLFNHPNFADPVANDLHLSSAFGHSLALAGRGFESFYTIGGARTMRFSLKLVF